MLIDRWFPARFEVFAAFGLGPWSAEVLFARAVALLVMDVGLPNRIGRADPLPKLYKSVWEVTYFEVREA